MTGLQEGSFLHSGRGQGAGSSTQGKLGMREDGSAILTCLALFSSQSRSCFVSSLENLYAITVLGVGRSEAPAPEQRVEGEKPRSELLYQARLSTWPQPCPLLATPPRCAHPAEPSAPQAQVQAQAQADGESP